MKPKKRKEGIHIQRSLKNKKFFVDEVASNGNILQASETVNRKQSAFKNILTMGKLFADVMSGKAHVTDEKGHHWVRQPNGKFINTTVFMRGELLPVLKTIVKNLPRQRPSKKKSAKKK